MDINIRPAKKEDLESCFKLAQIPELETSPGEFPSREELGAALESPISIFLVAKVADEVVGFTLGYLLSRHECYLEFLVVEKSHRNQGVGTKLLLEIESRAKAKGAKNIFLISHLENMKGYQFYIDKHFKPEDKFQLFERKIS